MRDTILFMKFLGLCALVYGLGMLYFPTAFADHSININTADKAALVTLTGIGEVKAQAIIDYRAQSGPYASKEDIQNVSGIGPATYESIKDHITVQGGNTTAPSPSPSPTPSASPSTPSPAPGSLAAGSSSLSIEAGGDRSVTAGADVEFAASAYLDKKPLHKGANFYWNFGDGTTGRGALISHRFEHAGKYAVIVEVRAEGQSAFDRFVVSADEADIAVFVGGDGSVGIENRGARDVDLSYWSVRSQGGSFVFSENSIVLSGQSIRLSPSTLGFVAVADAELAFPGGEVAVRAGETDHVLGGSLPDEAPREVPASPAQASRDLSEPEEEENDDELEEDALSASSSQTAAAASTASSGSWTWWAAALGIALVGAGSIYFARRFAKGEWDIIEDKES